MYEPSEDTVLFIASYMNDMQPDAILDIARATGAEADQALLAGISALDMTIRVRRDGRWTDLRLPWPSPLRRREDIRTHLLEMQEDARFAAPSAVNVERTGR